MIKTPNAISANPPTFDVRKIKKAITPLDGISSQFVIDPANSCKPYANAQTTSVTKTQAEKYLIVLMQARLGGIRPEKLNVRNYHMKQAPIA